jgi:hypothetical protein
MSQVSTEKLEAAKDVLHELFVETWKAGDVETARKFAKAHDEISLRISEIKKVGAMQ